MDKISHIVAGKPRVSTADVKSSAPVRPGTPSFGRPVGVSTMGNQDSMTTAQKATELMVQQEDKRARDVRHSQVVQQAADQFFMSKGRALEKPAVTHETESRSEIDVPRDMETEPMEELSEQLIASSTDKYTPRGSYIDVRV